MTKRSAEDMDTEPKQKKTDLITLTRHQIYQQRFHPQSGGHLTLLLQSIQLACKYISNKVRKAGLANLTGLAGNVNIQGEDVKKLDVVSNDVFISALQSCGEVCVMVSEENDDVIVVEDKEMRGHYAVVFDPLDGSSNIDAGVNIGTIFGVFRVGSDCKCCKEDLYKPGKEMVAAGYAMYGSATTLVISTGNGVNGYTLDPSLGEFILSHKDIKIPERGNIYSINEGNSIYWDKPTTEYITNLKSAKAPGGKPYSARYIGSMVADVHRTLLYGGVFCYPADSKSTKGKLRVLYECFPMSFIMEQAGGKATTGHSRILDMVPTDIHQRSPIFLGSKKDVEDLEALYAKK